MSVAMVYSLMSRELPLTLTCRSCKATFDFVLKEGDPKIGDTIDSVMEDFMAQFKAAHDLNSPQCLYDEDQVTVSNRPKMLQEV